jgi:poly(hydroxyalkanoate) depolymerase family esterase
MAPHVGAVSTERGPPLRKLSTVLSSLAANKKRWRELMRLQPTSAPLARESHIANRFHEVTAFGSNPGNLRMFVFAPSRKSPRPALVVALHGCTQTAASYDYGAGWSKLADRYGFVVLAPQQQKSNNPNTCFTWFQPGDTTRGQGEAMSIRQMIDRAIVEYDIDLAHVYITGLSAGGAMASVMLAAYPEVFAAGAIVAGLPFGSADTLEQAFESMFKGPRLSGDEFAALARSASAHEGPWPRISVWHGTADQIVKPENASAIIEQWRRLHALPSDATTVSKTPAYHYRRWTNARGETLIEDYLVTGMGHGVPLATGDADAVGVPGPYFLETTISSTENIAAFFGITEHIERGALDLPESLRRTEPVVAEEMLEPVPWPAQSGAARGDDWDPAEHMEQRRTSDPVVEPAAPQGAVPSKVDVGAIINNALRAAGLLR